MSDADALAELLRKIFTAEPAKRSQFLPKFFSHLINYSIYLDGLDKELQDKKKILAQSTSAQQSEQQKLSQDIARLSMQIDWEMHHITNVITPLIISLCIEAPDQDKATIELIDFLETCRSAIDLLINTPEYSQNANAQHYSKHLLRMVNIIFEQNVVRDAISLQMEILKDKKILPFLHSYLRPPFSCDLFAVTAKITDELKVPNPDINENLIHAFIILGNELLKMQQQEIREGRHSVSVSSLKAKLNRDPMLRWIKASITQLSAESINIMQMLSAVLRRYAQETGASEEYKALGLAVAVYGGFITEREDEIRQVKELPFVNAMQESFHLLDLERAKRAKDLAAAKRVKDRNAEKIKRAFECLDEAKHTFDAYLEYLQSEAAKLPKDDRAREFIPRIVPVLREAANDYYSKIRENPYQAKNNAEVFDNTYKSVTQNASNFLGGTTGSTVRKLLWGLAIAFAALCTAGVAIVVLCVAYVIPESNRYLHGIFHPIQSSLGKANQQIDQFTRAAVQVSAAAGP